MKKFSTVGLDIAKGVFQVHGVDDAGQVLERRKLRRGQVLGYSSELEPCLIGLEACSGAHYWARELGALGHEVRLLPPGDVKAYVRRGKKSDAVDAEAICEAVGRPRITSVSIKSPAQQAELVRHRTRDLLVRQRTMQINALRAHMAEFGIIAAKGSGGFKSLLELLHSAEEASLPSVARETLLRLAAVIGDQNRHIDALEEALVKAVKAEPRARRLMTMPGIGPINASALAATLGDARAFANGRHLSAWLGLVPSQHGTGGKLHLGPITKRGDRYLRRLLVLGATSILRRPKSDDPLAAWAAKLIDQGKPPRLVTVALANRMARIAWALLAKEEVYNPKALA